MRIVERQSTDVLAVADAEVAAAIRHLRDKALTPGTLDQIVADIPMSRSTLERRFKETLGRTPGLELRRLRIERAMQLLAETELPLKTVARHCGFSAPRHMTYAMKQEIGELPGDYRARLRMGLAPSEP